MLIVVVVCGLIVVWLADRLSRQFRLPPGPWGLPMVGYLPWMTKTPACKLFMELGKKYGGLFSIKLGSETVVVLNDWDTIRATLVNQPQLFSGRPERLTFEKGGKKRDISFSDGPVWKQQRNMAIQCLKTVGMGNTMKNHYRQLVQDIIQKFDQLDKQVVQMDHLFFESLLKANWKLLSSHDVTSDKSKLDQFQKIVRNVLDGFACDQPFDCLPWLRLFQRKGTGYWKFNDFNDQLWTFVRRTVNRHMTEWVEGSDSCLIDCYINKINRNEEIALNCQPPYNVEHLVGTVWDILLAGVDTVSHTLIWGCLYLAYYPHVQLMIQQELVAVVGRQRSPQVKDFPQLPYLEAFVMEVHRCSSVVGLSLPHCPTSHTAEISGYVIPKGTPCLQNIYAVHHDPKLWEEPELFKPERFLDRKNRVKSSPYLMPFSVGPRQCIGQPLAEMQLRLVFSCILHRFNLSLPPNRPKPSLEHERRFLFQAQPYSLLIESRKDIVS